jgi:hypothetical protein
MPYDLLTSKKFIASILASILALVGLMYGMDIAEIAVIVAPLTGYTLSQGLADFGKEGK